VAWVTGLFVPLRWRGGTADCLPIPRRRKDTNSLGRAVFSATLNSGEDRKVEQKRRAAKIEGRKKQLTSKNE
jgi:hypothetical protein